MKVALSLGLFKVSPPLLSPLAHGIHRHAPSLRGARSILHHDRVLGWERVVQSAAPRIAEAFRLVESSRSFVAVANLEVEHSGTTATSKARGHTKKKARQTPPSKGRPDTYAPDTALICHHVEDEEGDDGGTHLTELAENENTMGTGGGDLFVELRLRPGVRRYAPVEPARSAASSGSATLKVETEAS